MTDAEKTTSELAALLQAARVILNYPTDTHRLSDAALEAVLQLSHYKRDPSDLEDQQRQSSLVSLAPLVLDALKFMPVAAHDLRSQIGTFEDMALNTRLSDEQIAHAASFMRQLLPAGPRLPIPRRS